MARHRIKPWGLFLSLLPGMAVSPKSKFWAKKATNTPRRVMSLACIELQYRRHECQEAIETAFCRAWVSLRTPD